MDTRHLFDPAILPLLDVMGDAAVTRRFMQNRDDARARMLAKTARAA